MKATFITTEFVPADSMTRHWFAIEFDGDFSDSSGKYALVEQSGTDPCFVDSDGCPVDPKLQPILDHAVANGIIVVDDIEIISSDDKQIQRIRFATADNIQALIDADEISGSTTVEKLLEFLNRGRI